MYLYCICTSFVASNTCPRSLFGFGFRTYHQAPASCGPSSSSVVFFYCISTAFLLYLCCISNVFVLYLYQFCIVFVLNLYCICTTKHQHHVAPPPHPFLPHLFPSLFVLFGFCPSWKKLCDHIIVQDPLVRLLIILYKYMGPMKT